MTRIIQTLLIVACTAGFVPLAAAAQAPASFEGRGVEATPPARASLLILRSLQVGATGPVLLHADAQGGLLGHAGGSAMVETPTVIRVSGDPNRLYRIRLSDPVMTESGDGAVITPMTIVSDNSGDVSQSRAARLDAGGQDILRIQGRLHTTGPASSGPALAMLPLSLDYE